MSRGDRNSGTQDYAIISLPNSKEPQLRQSVMSLLPLLAGIVSRHFSYMYDVIHTLISNYYHGQCSTVYACAWPMGHGARSGLPQIAIYTKSDVLEHVL